MALVYLLLPRQATPSQGLPFVAHLLLAAIVQTLGIQTEGIFR